jgi:hypothetical protein
MKILIAVDDSKWSQAAVDFVKRMSWPSPTEMVVLSVNPLIGSPYVFQGVPDALPVCAPELEEKQQQYHKELAERYAVQLRDAGDGVRAEP